MIMRFYVAEAKDVDPNDDCPSDVVVAVDHGSETSFVCKLYPYVLHNDVDGREIGEKIAELLNQEYGDA